MNQRMALILAGALTAFVLVMMAGVGLAVAVQSFAATNAAAQLQAPASDVASPQESSASNAVVTQLSPGQAAVIAMGVVPNAKLTRVPELVDFQGTVAYEVLLNQGNVYVDANSGKVLLNGATTSVAASAPVRGGERRGDGGSNQQHEGDNDD